MLQEQADVLLVATTAAHNAPGNLIGALVQFPVAPWRLALRTASCSGFAHLLAKRAANGLLDLLAGKVEHRESPAAQLAR